MTLVGAQHKLPLLTNPDFHEIFTRTTAGQIVAGVQVELIALPREMQDHVDAVTERASREMAGDLTPIAAEIGEAGERGEDVGT